MIVSWLAPGPQRHPPPEDGQGLTQVGQTFSPDTACARCPASAFCIAESYVSIPGAPRLRPDRKERPGLAQNFGDVFPFLVAQRALRTDSLARDFLV